MGVLLALGSAAMYGVADFAGGLLSRRAGFAVVALLGQAGGLVLMAIIAPVLPGEPSAAGLLWGGLSGVGTGLGMVFLFRGLGRGAMSVVVPVSAVGGLAIPVLVGIALLGDRPTVLAVTGMVLAVPALWLVSHRGRTESAGSLDALLAGLGIAVQYLALAQAPPDAGLWPVLAGRVTATLAVLPIAWRSAARTRTTERDPTRAAGGGHASTVEPDPTDTTEHTNASSRRRGSVITARRVGPGTVLGAVAVGGCATLALVAYLLATREQLLSIAVVLSSLYPAIPVLLGLTVLRERLNRAQLTGLVTAGVAIALLTLG